MKKSVIAVAVGVLLVSHGAVASPCGEDPCFYIENGLNVNIDLTDKVGNSKGIVNIARPSNKAIEQGGGRLGVINITVTGSPSHIDQVNGLNLNNQNKEFFIDSFSFNSKLSPQRAPGINGNFNPNALQINEGKLTIGDVYIHSVVTVDEQYKNNIGMIPHNGLYSSGNGTVGAVVTINGSVYINNEIPLGYQENYDISYTDHSSKSDAVSGKKGGTVIINPLGGKDVQLFGNLDVSTNGTIELTMDTPASRWEGHLVAAKYENGSFNSYGKKFNLTLSNGARWIPDVKEEYIGKYDPSIPDSSDFQSVVNLNKGGIIDLYGDNRHTGNKGYTNKLTIDNLQAEKGRFIIFSSLDNSKNDMLFIKNGNGTALVEPVDPKELKDVSTQKPILFADVSKTISFEGYDNIETLDDGFLYSYVPVVEKNVLDAPSTPSKYGDLWYIVGVTKNETPAIEVPVSDANLHFASATSFLALIP